MQHQIQIGNSLSAEASSLRLWRAEPCNHAMLCLFSILQMSTSLANVSLLEAVQRLNQK